MPGRRPFTAKQRGVPRPIEDVYEVVIDLGQAESIEHPQGTPFEIEAQMPGGERVLIVLSDRASAQKVQALALDAELSRTH